MTTTPQVLPMDRASVLKRDEYGALHVRLGRLCIVWGTQRNAGGTFTKIIQFYGLFYIRDYQDAQLGVGKYRRNFK